MPCLLRGVLAIAVHDVGDEIHVLWGEIAMDGGVIEEPARDFEGAGPYGQGEVLSQYLEPVPPDFRYFPAECFTLADGSLLVKCLRFGIDCAELHPLGDPDYEFWRWLSA